MTSLYAGLRYSFSMINLLKLIPEWSWDDFDRVMDQAGTNKVELVPSMLLGMGWDQEIEAEQGHIQQALDQLMQRFTVGSIQSLTYGLEINLADSLVNHPALLRRLQALALLSKHTACSVLILGSPGQKKRLDSSISHAEHKQRFISNCCWMAVTLGPSLILSLEHNTSLQGAEYCNTLNDIVDVVKIMRGDGVANVGLNLDTKCLIHEFTADVRVGDLLAQPGLAELITSIQLSYDFLLRKVCHADEDLRQLISFSLARNVPLSLEEYGLTSQQLSTFVEAFKSRV